MKVWLIPTAIAVCLQLWLNLYVLAHPPVRPIRAALHAMLFAALLFTVGDLLASFVFINETERWAGLILLYTGLIFVSPTWWLLALRYCEAQQLGLDFTRKNWVYIPFLLAGLLWIGLVTNPLHHQFITPRLTGASEFHWMFWWNAVQSYALLMGVAGLYGTLILRQHPGATRNQLIILLSATLATAIASAIYVFYPAEIPFDPTSIGVCISSILFIYGIRGSRLFSLSPVDLTTVIQSHPAGVLVINSTGQLLYANQAADTLLGSKLLPVEDDPFQSLSRILSLPESRDQAIEPRQLQKELFRIDQPAHGHLFRFGDDREGWLKIESVPLPGRRETIRAWSLLLADQTPSKNAADAIQASEIAILRSRNLESLGVMAGGIAHDFNNLLQGILGNTELALEEVGTQSMLSEHLLDIEEASLRAGKLVAQLLLFTGAAVTEKRDHDFAETLSQIAEFAASSIPDQVTFEISQSTDLPMIRVDPDQIKQAVVNLVVNASEAIGDETGAIRLAVSAEQVTSENVDSLNLLTPIPPGLYLKIEITDDGDGMPKEVRARIFEPFYSTKFPGRGLGLSALLGIVRTHSGGLSVQTKATEGTCASVYLPAMEDTAQQAALSVPSIPATSGLRVLVVDDELAVRSVCTRALRIAGADVVEAETGEAAVDYATEHDIDVAIVDLTMPGIGGLETARQLRSLHPGLRIILSSGHRDTDIQANIDSDLICDFLHKPYRPSELLDLLNQLLNTKLDLNPGPA
jgi:signal transduction histidine kinase/ActR/RegA family two-component response regulator